MRHRLTVKNGKSQFQDLDRFKEELRGLEGKDCIIDLKEWKGTRSNNQNRYYWGVVLKILGDELGYLPEEMHEAMKYKFLAHKTVSLGREQVIVGGSTRNLTTSELEDYLSKIKAWAARDMSVVIPDPNEIKY
jgi:hypothetical protein